MQEFLAVIELLLALTAFIRVSTWYNTQVIGALSLLYADKFQYVIIFLFIRHTNFLFYTQEFIVNHMA